MHKVTLWPSGSVVEMNEKDSVFEQLKEAGIPVKSTCAGFASCGQCKVVITSGGENLNEPSFEEKQLIGNVFHITKERLSCQTFVKGAVTVDISAHKDEPKITKTKAIRRTREEADTILAERREAGVEKRKVKVHKLGGGKKPKPFNFSNDEDS
jgi:ferredoxin